MAEKEKLKKKLEKPDPELLKEIELLENLELLKMMRDLNLLDDKAQKEKK